MGPNPGFTELMERRKEADEIQALTQGEDGTVTFFIRVIPVIDKTSSYWKSGGFLSTPVEVSEGKVKATFLGSARAVKSFLGLLAKSGAAYRVELLTDARFSPDSPIAHLTDKQRKVIISAFNLGCYDIPRRIGSRELAKKFGVSNPTLVMERRRGERRMLAEMLRES
jgi:predicted DNA binding protein